MKPLPPVIMTLFKIPEIILCSYIFYIHVKSDGINSLLTDSVDTIPK